MPITYILLTSFSAGARGVALAANQYYNYGFDYYLDYEVKKATLTLLKT